MSAIVTQPTTTALWHSLILDAEQACKQTLDSEIESYLVFLLMRFTQESQFAGKIMAMEFLEGMQASGKQQQVKLRDVADGCLLTSGLFPQHARRRQVTVRYYMDIGRSAYLQLALACGDALAAMYHELAGKFAALMDVLHAVRELSGEHQRFEPLDLHAMWQAGSQGAFQRLVGSSQQGALPLVNARSMLH